MYFNDVKLVGRVTKDPEERFAGNKMVASFGLAVDRGTKDKDGEKVTDFFDIETWEKQAEYVTQYLKKGKLVLVSGSLRNDRWKDDDGNPKSKTKITANVVRFLEKKDSSDE